MSKDFTHSVQVYQKDFFMYHQYYRFLNAHHRPWAIVRHWLISALGFAGKKFSDIVSHISVYASNVCTLFAVRLFCSTCVQLNRFFSFLSVEKLLKTSSPLALSDLPMFVSGYNQQYLMNRFFLWTKCVHFHSRARNISIF